MQPPWTPKLRSLPSERSLGTAAPVQPSVDPAGGETGPTRSEARRRLVSRRVFCRSLREEEEEEEEEEPRESRAAGGRKTTEGVGDRAAVAEEEEGEEEEGEHDDSDDDGDDADLAAAIAASLAEASQAVYGPPVEEGDGGAPDGEDAAPEGGDAATADERPNDATGGGCGTSGGSSGATCVVCLTEPAVMLMRPCNHVCGCAGCARRLVRRPCPLCRKLVAKTERVFF